MKPRFLGLTPDGRRRWAADYEVLPPIAGGSNGADPTSDDQVDASADDAAEVASTGGMNVTGTSVLVWSATDAGSRRWGGLRFHNGPFPAIGSTIDVAYIQIYTFSTIYDDMNCAVHAQDVAAPGVFTADAFNISTRARTAASVAWVQNSLGVGWEQSPSIVSIVQEIANDYSPTALVIIFKPNSDAMKQTYFRSYDGSATEAAKLHLEWTEGGVTTFTPAPVTLPFSVPSPTLSLGTATITPSPVAIVTDVPLVTISSTVTLTSAPVTLPLVVVEPSLVLGSVVLTPAPITIPFAIPNHLIVGAGAIFLLADPVTMPLVVADPTLVMGAIALTPAPVTTALVVPDAQVVAVCTLSPAPVTIPVTVPEPSMTPGICIITPGPAVATWVVPTHTLYAPGAEGFTQFGNLIRLIVRADFPPTALLYFEAIIKTRDPAKTAKARLYNITDGIIVPDSEVTTTSTTAQRLRSTALTLSGAKEYRTEFGGDGGGEYTCYAADIIVDSG